VRLATLLPSCADCLESGSLNLLEPSGPVQACNGIALYLMYNFRFRTLKASCVEGFLFRLTFQSLSSWLMRIKDAVSMCRRYSQSNEC
jgi:hypothetical protein